jgi:hypothetical protein
MGYLDPLFGRVYANGVPVPLVGGLNFAPPYTLSVTQDADGNDVITLGLDQSAIEATIALPQAGDRGKIPCVNADEDDIAYSDLKLENNGSALITRNLFILSDAPESARDYLWWNNGTLTLGAATEFSQLRLRAHEDSSVVMHLGAYGAGPSVKLDGDGLWLSSGLELVLGDVHLLKNDDYLWSTRGVLLGFPLGPFEVPDDISDTTINVGGVHVGRRNRCTAATAVTINLAAESTQPIGSFVNFTQAGDGQLTFVAGAGVTTLTPETLKSRKKGSTISAYRVSATHWDITGDLELA